jgi:hypothetical protein
MVLRPPLLLLAAAAVAATEAAPASPWSWKTKLGVYLQNVASHNTATSRDPAISGTTDSTAYKTAGEGQLVWKHDRHRIEQKLEAEYGQIRTETDQTWQEHVDRIAYALTYERTLTAPHFIYGGGTAESVFSGKDPDNAPLDPVVAKLSAGYGQRREHLLPLSDALVWRMGAYAKKRWERDVPHYQRDIDSGPEAFIRYERKQSEDVSYFAQGESFGEFTDATHVTNLLQAGLTVKVAKLLTVELKARAYYETQPEEADRSDPGYDAWSARQEALIGLVWETGSE